MWNSFLNLAQKSQFSHSYFTLACLLKDDREIYQFDMFMMFFLGLPSCLCFYWVISHMLEIWLIIKQMRFHLHVCRWSARMNSNTCDVCLQMKLSTSSNVLWDESALGPASKHDVWKLSIIAGELWKFIKDPEWFLNSWLWYIYFVLVFSVYNYQSVITLAHVADVRKVENLYY